MGTTYVVNPYGTGDFPTIQSAIESVQDGDVIELTDGVFRGEGNRDIDYLGKAITVRSQSGNAEVCIIDCEGSASQRHRGFLFRNYFGPSAVLEQVTVTGGYAPGSFGLGGAVMCSVGVSPTLRDCRFVGNYATAGGGVYCAWASPTLNGCVFIENSAVVGGGMICVDGAPVLLGCGFFNNTAEDNGGGFKGAGYAFAQFEGCTFAWNASGTGGGIYT
jgi:hypothetical protein